MIVKITDEPLRSCSIYTSFVKYSYTLLFKTYVNIEKIDNTAYFGIEKKDIRQNLRNDS